MLQWEMSRSLADSCTFSTRLRLCVCVRLRESKAANRESLCISSMSVGLLGDLKKTGFLSSLSLSLFLSLARSLSPLGLCYANVEGCSGFIVIFHLASDER